MWGRESSGDLTYRRLQVDRSRLYRTNGRHEFPDSHNAGDKLINFEPRFVEELKLEANILLGRVEQIAFANSRVYVLVQGSNHVHVFDQTTGQKLLDEDFVVETMREAAGIKMSADSGRLWFYQGSLADYTVHCYNYDGTRDANRDIDFSGITDNTIRSRLSTSVPCYVYGGKAYFRYTTTVYVIDSNGNRLAGEEFTTTSAGWTKMFITNNRLYVHASTNSIRVWSLANGQELTGESVTFTGTRTGSGSTAYIYTDYALHNNHWYLTYYRRSGTSPNFSYSLSSITAFNTDGSRDEDEDYSLTANFSYPRCLQITDNRIYMSFGAQWRNEVSRNYIEAFDRDGNYLPDELVELFGSNRLTEVQFYVYNNRIYTAQRRGAFVKSSRLAFGVV